MVIIIISQPGPYNTTLKKFGIKYITINARNLKSMHKLAQSSFDNNLSCVQDFVYSEEAEFY